MKKIFLSLPMKNRSDEAIKKTIEGMRRIVRAYFPEDEDILFIDNFEAGYDIPQKMIDSSEHPSLLYLSKAIFKMAGCTHIAFIRSNVFYRSPDSPYNGCEIEELIADRYKIIPIPIADESGEILLKDLKEKVEVMYAKEKINEKFGIPNI